MLEPVLKNPWVRAAGALLALVLLAVLAYLLSFVLIPLFLAFLVAYVFDPVADYFEVRGIPRIAVALSLASIALIALVSIPLIGIPMVINEAEELVSNARAEHRDEWADVLFESRPVQILVKRMGWAETVQLPPQEPNEEPAMAVVLPVEAPVADDPVAADVGIAVEPESVPVDEATAEGDEIVVPEVKTESAIIASTQDDVNERAILAAKVREWVENKAIAFFKTHTQDLVVVGQHAGTTVAGIFASVGNRIIDFILLIGNFVLFSVVAIYLLNDFDQVLATMDELVPPRYRGRFRDIMHRIDLQLRGFLRGQGIVCLGLGMMYLLGFVLSGVPFAVPLAVFGGVASFVPYLGFILTIGPALFLTLLEYGIDWHIAGAIATFIIAQAIESNLLTPKVMGAQVGLGPVWVILAIMVFSGALGFLGLLLAVPTAAVLKVLVVEGVAYYKSSGLYQRGTSTDVRPPAPGS
jgi:predicted PurR-regulated permease PerM